MLDRGVADRPRGISVNQLPAGLFQQCLVVALAQGEDVQAGAIPLGFDRAGIEHAGDRGDGVGTDLVGLTQEIRPGPQVRGLLMLIGDMIGVGDVDMLARGDGMGGDDVPVAHDRQAVAGDLHINVASGEGVGHRVLHRGDFDVVITVDLGFPPGHRLPAGLRQPKQFRPLILIEQILAADLLSAERCSGVDRGDLVGHSSIEVIQAGESLAREPADHPVGHDLDPGFDIAFVLWFYGTGRYRSGAVVLEEIPVGAVDVPGPVPTSDLVGCGGGVVRDDDLRDTAEELEGLLVGVQPVRGLLIEVTAGEDQPGVRQRGHEHRHLGLAPGDGVEDGHLRARPVDLHRVTGNVGDPHGQVVDIDVLADDLAEPLIAVVPLARDAVRVEVAGPQHAQRELLLARAFGDHRGHVEGDELIRGRLAPVGEQGVEFFRGEVFHLGGGGKALVPADSLRFGDGGV